jgi:hypothetical protein
MPCTSRDRNSIAAGSYVNLTRGEAYVRHKVINLAPNLLHCGTTLTAHVPYVLCVVRLILFFATGEAECGGAFHLAVLSA